MLAGVVTLVPYGVTGQQDGNKGQAEACPSKNLPFLFRFAAKRVPQSERIAWLVKFALNGILRAALIKAEDLIGKIEAVNDQVQPTIHSKAPLRIHLRVSVEVDISARPLLP